MSALFAPERLGRAGDSVSSRPVGPDAPGSSLPAPVTVVVVSWNTQELLDRCLHSLEADAQGGLAEVWVVDNASSDGSAAMVRERHPWVRLVALSENLGYGQAANLVALRTSSHWIAVSNSDVEVEPGALEALIRAGEADPAAGVVAPRLLLPGGSTQHLAWAFPTIRATLAQNLGPHLVPQELAERLALRGAWNPERPRRIPWAVGAFLLVRRTAWEQIGGFDPTLWLSAEDLDLGWRMREANWFTRYEPAAVVHHAESAATRTVWGDDLAIHWQRCAYAWMLRRYGRGRTMVVGTLNLAGSGVRLVVELALSGFRTDERIRGLWRWTRVHLYAYASRRTLARYH
jgi:GT2 family glycosyltransferase